MKIVKSGVAQIVMQNPGGMHDYFAWPSVAKLKNGDIAIASSGFRIAHVCPFGKAVMSISKDGGNTYSLPAPVIDTSLDDRDAGLCPFGKSGLIVTSFNNSTEFQRGNALTAFKDEAQSRKKAYVDAYLDTVPGEKEAADLGSNFRVSFDNGVTFGKMYHCPVTSPHGPLELSDGTVLWVGRIFSRNDSFKDGDRLYAYSVDPESGKCEKISVLPLTDIDGVLMCEPHTAQLPSGKLVCHIRVQRNGEDRIYTTFQTTSTDMGKTWTKPIRVMGLLEGAPAHLLVHSSGALICTYGHREPTPNFAVKAMISYDEGETWSDPETVCDEYSYTPDMGYPETIETDGGELLTIFYCHPEKNGPANILQQKWRFEK